MDKDVEGSREVSEPEETTSIPEFSSPPRGVVVVRQDPVARLTLWLPGQVQDAEHNIASQSEDDLIFELKPDYLPELQLSTTDQDSLPYPLSNEINGESLNELKSDSFMLGPNFHTLLDGWLVPPLLDSAVTVKEFQRKNRLGGSGKFGTEAPQKVNFPLSVEMNVENNFNQIKDELAQMQADAPVTHSDGTNEVKPIIRSKIQFSKGTDGTQTLSYEEEFKEDNGKGVIRRCGMQCIKQEAGQKGLYSIFLDLLR